MRPTRDDRLDRAAYVLTSFTVFCAIVLLCMAADAVFRPDTPELQARQIVRQFGLDSMALIPTGHPQRHPGGRLPAVDLRHIPRLPLESPDAGVLQLEKVSR